MPAVISKVGTASGDFVLQVPVTGKVFGTAVTEVATKTTAYTATAVALTTTKSEAATMTAPTTKAKAAGTTTGAGTAAATTELAYRGGGNVSPRYPSLKKRKEEAEEEKIAEKKEKQAKAGQRRPWKTPKPNQPLLHQQELKKHQ